MLMQLQESLKTAEIFVIVSRSHIISQRIYECIRTFDHTFLFARAKVGGSNFNAVESKKPYEIQIYHNHNDCHPLNQNENIDTSVL